MTKSGQKFCQFWYLDAPYVERQLVLRFMDILCHILRTYYIQIPVIPLCESIDDSKNKGIVHSLNKLFMPRDICRMELACGRARAPQGALTHLGKCGASRVKSQIVVMITPGRRCRSFPCSSVHLLTEISFLVTAVLHVGGALDKVLVHDAYQSLIFVETQLGEEGLPNLSQSIRSNLTDGGIKAKQGPLAGC